MIDAAEIFDAEHVTTDPEDIDDFRATAEHFRTAISVGVLMSLGASELHFVPGRDQLGGLTFIARILPMTKDGRGTRARRMAVMVSLTGADLIDVDVRELAGQHRTHATIRGIYIDQLARAILALDYDGPEALNPRYWRS